MSRTRTATVGIALAAAAVLMVLAGPSAPAGAQTSTTSAASTSTAPPTDPAESTTSTTFDPTSETAPVIELTPDDSAPSDADDESDDAQKWVIFAAAVLLPVAGIAFLVWYARRMVRVANARAEARENPDTDDDA